MLMPNYVASPIETAIFGGKTAIFADETVIFGLFEALVFSDIHYSAAVWLLKQSNQVTQASPAPQKCFRILRYCFG